MSASSPELPRSLRSGSRRLRTPTMALLVATLLTVGVVVVGPAPAGAAEFPSTGRVSVSTAGSQATAGAATVSRISDDGRYVAFASDASLLFLVDTNGSSDVYLRDRLAGTTVRVSETNAGSQLSADSELCGMSGSGRWILFRTAAPQLSANGSLQLFRADRDTGAVVLVSRTNADAVLPSPGITNNGCDISDDGNLVVFPSDVSADNQVEGAADTDLFVRDVSGGTTERISVSSAEVHGNATSLGPSISDDGDRIAFRSSASNLTAGDANGVADIFVRDRSAGTTVIASVSSAESPSNATSNTPRISGNGAFVGFSTDSALVVGDTNGATDAFLRDLGAGTTSRVSISNTEAQTDEDSYIEWVSDGGSHVAFRSLATNLGSGTPNAPRGYVRDRTAGSTNLVTRSTGAPANDEVSSMALSGNGDVVSYSSSASNLVRNDSNAKTDVFVYDSVGLGPHASNAQFVIRQYLDFDGRSPTVPEQSEAMARILNMEITPERLVIERARADAWAKYRSPVVRLYWAFFLRKPDLGGLNYWTGQLAGGKTIQQVAFQYAKSSEFQNTYGALSNSQFVTLVYQNVLERDPDGPGLTYWTAQLDQGLKTRGDVMANFSESSEGRRLLQPQVDTVLVYLGMLRVMPPDSAFSLWVGILRGSVQPLEYLVRAVLGSGGYAARF